ncbi:MAG: hypothetical protein FD169_2163 [Bacillota bacterium]|nr:MAG: hypothetical protein FD169_2163 [Bacillota bacterium]
MEIVRVVELPRCSMVSSGCSTEQDPFTEDGLLMRFDRWWSAVDAERQDKFFPRDFMWFDRERNGLVWYYAASPMPATTEGFEIIDFPGGMYAAAVARDGDDEDGNRVRKTIADWIVDSGSLEFDPSRGHSELFHVITSTAAAEALGYSQLEILVPVRPRL